MKITDQEVARVADLARLRFSPDERVVLAGQLNRILQYFESLADVETEGIEPMHVLQPANALRCDEERSCMPLNAVFCNAPDQRKKSFQSSKNHRGLGMPAEVLRCAHWYERQTAWHLHRPLLQ